MCKEIWRDIPEYEGLYQVSSTGLIKSLAREEVHPPCLRNGVLNKGHIYHRSERILKGGQPHKYGRYKWLGIQVALCKECVNKHFYIHDIVAKAFPEICGEWFPGAQVNHKNENPTDNRAENLEWCTPEYNINYGTGNERRKTTAKKNRRTKHVYQYTISGEFIKEWDSIMTIERELGYKSSNISATCLGKCHHKTSYGYKWSHEQL